MVFIVLQSRMNDENLLNEAISIITTTTTIINNINNKNNKKQHKWNNRKNTFSHGFNLTTTHKYLKCSFHKNIQYQQYNFLKKKMLPGMDAAFAKLSYIKANDY